MKFWQNRSQEIEEKYIKLLESEPSSQSMVKAIRGRKKKQKVCNNDGDSQLSDYAVEVVFDFFLKVSVFLCSVKIFCKKRVCKLSMAIKLLLLVSSCKL